MALPELTADDVSKLLPEVSDIGEPMFGGQKLVFPCTFEDSRWVVKFALIEVGKDRGQTPEQIQEKIDHVTARIEREVRVMGLCDSPHIAKLGPIPTRHVDFRGQSLIYFCEEFIDGENLRRILIAEHILSTPELIRLGLNITEAIQHLWSHRQIHRDIKPENIMRRNSDGSFVLLDMGLAFDLADRSLTRHGFVVGTFPYYSPEQLDLGQRRLMDFRSDIFLLGHVLYEAATGVHPFLRKGLSDSEIYERIRIASPELPTLYRKDLPGELENIILRVLAKEPHLRYRSCERMTSALRAIQMNAEEAER